MQRLLETLAWTAPVTRGSHAQPSPPSSSALPLPPAPPRRPTYSPPEASGLEAVRAFPGPDDVCQVIGENSLTNDYLDDSSTLIGCPVAEPGAIADRKAEGATELTGSANGSSSRSRHLTQPWPSPSTTAPRPLCRPPATPRGCRHHRRRCHRGDDRMVPARQRPVGVPGRKGRIAGEQSSRNWGWVRQQGRDPAELPIMIEAMSIWRRLTAELGDGLGFRQTGVLYLAKTETEMQGFEAWTEHSRAHQLDTRLLTGAETAAMLTGATAPWKGALYTASDARAEPWVAVPMLAAEAEARGVQIREACAVRALDIAGAAWPASSPNMAAFLATTPSFAAAPGAAFPCPPRGQVPATLRPRLGRRHRTDAGNLPRQRRR